jgi:hypothetical protein
MDSLDMQILGLNGLSYPQSEELSLANAHRLRYFPALRDSYTGGSQGYIDISVGSDLIQGPASWIEFDLVVETKDNQPYTLPDNGVMALIRESITRARSGQELDRCTYANLFNHDNMAFECTYGTKQTVATAMTPGAQLISGQPYTFCIPLGWINPFFSSSRLIPTSSIGTIRLEMLFAPAEEAIITTTDTTASYTVNNVNIVVDTFSLSDAALRSMQMIASQSGLAYEWPSIHTTVNNSDGTAATFVSLKSASRALGAHLHIAETVRLTAQQADSMANEPFAVSQSQWSLGSQYLPVRKITTEVSHFLNALYSHDSLQHCREFAPQLSLTDYRNQYGVPACTLERSSVLQANGQATSSSRPLIADIVWKSQINRNSHVITIVIAWCACTDHCSVTL